jgi:hypothetical protein
MHMAAGPLPEAVGRIPEDREAVGRIPEDREAVGRIPEDRGAGAWASLTAVSVCSTAFAAVAPASAPPAAPGNVPAVSPPIATSTAPFRVS